MKSPTISYYVEFPESRTLMSTWCETLPEARSLVEHYGEDVAVIYAHVPILQQRFGETVSLIEATPSSGATSCLTQHKLDRGGRTG